MFNRRRKTIRLRLKPEEILQRDVIDFLKTQYPEAEFQTMAAANIKMTFSQAIKYKSLGITSKYPDIFICEPRGIYHGLFIELKTIETKLYKVRTPEFANTHIEGQAFRLQNLNLRNYFADFTRGQEETEILINEYMFLNPGEHLVRELLCSKYPITSTQNTAKNIAQKYGIKPEKVIIK